MKLIILRMPMFALFLLIFFYHLWNMQYFLKYEKHFNLIVFITALLLYINTIPNFYNMDDELVTINHRNTSKGISAIPDILSQYYYEDVMGYMYEYRPTVHISFAIEHEFFGESPHISHAINVLLYALTCLLLFIFLKNLFPQNLKLLAWIATLLFVFHPIHTEVVASIKNRDEILALLFALGSGIVLLKAIDSKKYWLISISILLFVIGAYSKVTILLFSFIFPVSLIFFRNLAFSTILRISVIFLILSAFIYPTISIKLRILISITGIAGIILTQKIPFVTSIVLIVKNYLRNIWQLNKDAFKRSENWFKDEPILKLKKSVGENTLIIFNSIALIFFIIVFFLKTQLLFVPLIILGLFIFFTPSYKSLTYSIIIFSISYFIFSQNVSFVLFPSFIFIPIAILIYIAPHKIYRYILIALWISIKIIGEELLSVTDIFFTMPLFFVLASFFKYNRTVERVLKFLIVIFLVLIIKDLYIDYIGNIYVVIILSLPICLFLIFSKYNTFKKVVPLVILIMFIQVSYSTFDRYIDFSNSNNLSKIEVPVNSKLALNKELRPISFVENPINYDSSINEKISISLETSWHYIKKLTIPYPLGFYYGYAYFTTKNLFNINAIVYLIIILTLISSAIYFVYTRNHIISLGIILTLLFILQSSNLLFPIAGVAGDRYLFLPSIGFSIILAYYVLKINSKIVYLILVLILSGYTTITIKRNFEWKDKITLYEADNHYLKNSAQAQALLGYAYMEKITGMQGISQNEYMDFAQKAKVQFEKAIAIYPDFVNWWYDKSRIESELGLLDDALVSLKKSIEIEPGFLPDPYFNIANLYFHKKNYQEAIYYFKETIKWGYSSPSIYNTIAACYYELSNPNAAISTLNEGIQFYPNDFNLHLNLGRIYFELSDYIKAETYLENATKLDRENGEAFELLTKAREQL
jgi:tetratricopeptide (TPR) repeat protein